jgi:hypothetical protein
MADRAVRARSRRRRAPDLPLTALLALQCFILVVAAPVAAMEFAGGRLLLEVCVLGFGFLVLLMSDSPVTMVISGLAVSFGVASSILEFWIHSSTSVLVGEVGGFTALVLANYLIGRAVLAPGEITLHRVLGAVALYLGLGMMFATAYRIAYGLLLPSAIANIPNGIDGWQAYSSILYFSFSTLTSVGYGDIVPVHPLVRALTNLEAIIGQLYPATLLARLVTLELERHRR